MNKERELKKNTWFFKPLGIIFSPIYYPIVWLVSRDSLKTYFRVISGECREDVLKDVALNCKKEDKEGLK